MASFCAAVSCKKTGENAGSGLHTGCYAYTDEHNNISMEITHAGDPVEGDLHIALQEKDANNGKFIGHMHGDTLIATYTFMSEGMVSSREIAFLIHGETITQGYGEMNAEGTIFLHPDALHFEPDMSLHKIPCTTQ
ncbi:MAG: hypothetical protein R2794_04795 [Chitinophagales bacterium]